jgi:hypothetical protein
VRKDLHKYKVFSQQEIYIYPVENVSSPSGFGGGLGGTWGDFVLGLGSVPPLLGTAQLKRAVSQRR